MDDTTKYHLTQLSELERTAKNTKNDRKALVKKITQIKHRIYGSRSIRQFNMIQALLTHLWQTFSKMHKNRDDFVYDWKFWTGFIKRQIKRNQKGEFIEEIDTPKTLSIPECTQAEQNEFLKNTIELAWVLYKFPFDEWFKHYENNQNTA